jgi:hypothetical protein
MIMRSFINLVEGSSATPSDTFLLALRQWGDNTRLDRSRKEAALRRFASEAHRFRQDHEWLYRGQAISENDLRALQEGDTITVNLGGSLSSWTADSDVAHTFARFGEAEAAIVIMKQGLKPFFDFEILGAALERAGLAPKEDEFDLHDPIREQEVIVEHPPTMTVTPGNVLEWFGFDESGDQVRGQF